MVTSAGQLLEIAATSVVVATAYLGAVWWFIRPHFQRQVLQALKEEGPAYKAWNDSLYHTWREEQVDTHELATATHDTVKRLEREITEHRTEISEALRGLATMPQAMEHVAQAVHSLEQTVIRLDTDSRKHEIELAVLRDRRHRHREEA